MERLNLERLWLDLTMSLDVRKERTAFLRYSVKKNIGKRLIMMNGMQPSPALSQSPIRMLQSKDGSGVRGQTKFLYKLFSSRIFHDEIIILPIGVSSTHGIMAKTALSFPVDNFKRGSPVWWKCMGSVAAQW